MQVPRDLSKRMLEAVDQVPIVDVYERLVPERKRINQRVDFIAWLMAFARAEIRALGLEPSELALLGNMEAPPDDRWAVLSAQWPFLRTTGAGRIVLRIAWELFGAEDINEWTWKDISTHLWNEMQPGLYQELLHERGNIQTVLVDNAIDPAQQTCCARIRNCDRVLAISSRSELESWSQELKLGAGLTAGMLDVLVERFVGRAAENGCAGFVLNGPVQGPIPSDEQVAWALGRVAHRQEPSSVVEPDLVSHLQHSLFTHIAKSGLPVQVHVRGEAQVAALEALARQHADVRFAGACCRGDDAPSLGVLGQTLPNVALALVGVWRSEPVMARQALRNWLHRVPLSKVFALGGGMTMVEAVCVQAMIVREQIATVMAEMVAGGELDEGDAVFAMECVLGRNAQLYFGGK
jgi:hypothetical protein